ncbi:uncharacterized protein YbjT (DUF2867 family) [Anseongella ginsenosidimutans]|uniref:Uncharacterized protein YbjT (DUF2867 family) n=1 Tax=Anseongella ginsenosidimutans TaxID=496056 RepID=A0A4R3KTA6_9SPHI|nr:NAD(P)H-binding protein [Anseongella ginsenosidimutans]QEC53223.1 NAD-dependent epimerase/dehydratase family protein [Anseongella ginsenosidimutans]TCS87859.1 uncharacterized protein YbjT (DUF2867 family) [Anseongella ginsenosidimutans]
MNIVIGASGQVGSNILKEIMRRDLPVRAVVRDPAKLSEKNVETRTADLFNLEQLTQALQGGTCVFLLTPENPASNDIIGETKHVVDNYKKAIQDSGIKKVIGLSCVGAQIEDNTGNILMSRMLEEGISALDVQKVFVRPSYYYSNWLGFLETMKQYGVLPTFFPDNLKIDMNSPLDVAACIAGIIIKDAFSEDEKVIELTGPEKYNSLEVAGTFSKLLNKNIEAQPIPKEKWNETLKSAGFTENTAANLSDMTRAVIDHIAVLENPNKAVKLPSDLHQYLKDQLKNGEPI